VYRASSDDLPNPERGFFKWMPLWEPEAVTRAGLTLGYVSVRLDQYDERPLDDSKLVELAEGFSAVRRAGIKAIVRFQYNDDAVGRDASLERVLQHIDQLKPVFSGGSDVIACVQAGFIGAWGEWHSSTNGLDAEPSRNAILEALLDAVGRDRMVQVRAPRYKRAYVGPGQLTEATAFDGSHAARIGFHNDGFLGDASDLGTYEWPIKKDKQYLSNEGRFTPVGGEACSPTADAMSCRTVMSELEKRHFSFLNEGYHADVVAKWRKMGCFDKMSRRLGYRFVVQRAHWSKRGDKLYVWVAIKNRGYAAMYNRRPVYVVLDNGPNRFEVQLNVDPRRWEGGKKINFEFEVPLPVGPRRISLWLPDASPQLRDRPEYAVKFANEDMADREGLGLNVLGRYVP